MTSSIYSTREYPIMPITRKQREALFKIFQRDFPNYITPWKRHSGTKCQHCGNWSRPEVHVASTPYRHFRRTALLGMDGSGCIMVPWKGMWLGIEPDGYTHS